MKLLEHFEQGSLEWFQQRVGKITMSHAKELITTGRGVTRQNYILDTVAERLSGERMDTVSTRDMERGNFLEPYALEAFKMATGLNVRLVGFVLHDDERIGCSPDGLVGEDSEIEIKCPRPRQHIRNIYLNGLDQYRPQCQGNLWVTKRKFCYIISYCPWVPRIPIYIKRIERNETQIALIADSAIKAADEVDELVARSVEVRSAELLRAQALEARDAWDNVFIEIQGVANA